MLTYESLVVCFEGVVPKKGGNLGRIMVHTWTIQKRYIFYFRISFATIAILAAFDLFRGVKDLQVT